MTNPLSGSSPNSNPLADLDIPDFDLFGEDSNEIFGDDVFIPPPPPEPVERPIEAKAYHFIGWKSREWAGMAARVHELMQTKVPPLQRVDTIHQRQLPKDLAKRKLVCEYNEAMTDALVYIRRENPAAYDDVLAAIQKATPKAVADAKIECPPFTTAEFQEVQTTNKQLQQEIRPILLAVHEAERGLSVLHKLVTIPCKKEESSCPFHVMARKVLAMFYQVFWITPEEQKILRSAGESIVMALSKETLKDCVHYDPLTDPKEKAIYTRLEVKPWRFVTEKQEVERMILAERQEVNRLKMQIKDIRERLISFLGHPKEQVSMMYRLTRL